MFLQGFHNGEPERNVWYEYSIHYIHMKPVGFTIVYHVNSKFQVAEVGR